MVCMFSMWTAASFCYYLSAFLLRYLKGDFYINGIWSGLSECYAYYISNSI